MVQEAGESVHELGVVIQVVDVVEKFAKENDVKKIDTVVLQIGELSSMIPKYVEAVYPAATDKTLLEGTKLQIEVMPANGRCNQCENVFHLVEHDGVCPECGSSDCDMLSGREFYIKEIVCY